MKGKIERWNDDKGFGFIKSNEHQKDIFFHISDIKSRTSHRPQINDEVEFILEKTQKGFQAKNIRYTSEAFNTPKSVKKHQQTQKSSFNLLNIIYGAIALIIIIIIYKQFIQPKFFNNNDYKITSQPIINSTTSLVTSSNLTSSNFKCDGRQYCSQMNSLEEAYFFIQNCPNTKMDGNNDGEPCESDSRFH